MTDICRNLQRIAGCPMCCVGLHGAMAWVVALDRPRQGLWAGWIGHGKGCGWMWCIGHGMGCGWMWWISALDTIGSAIKAMYRCESADPVPKGPFFILNFFIIKRGEWAEVAADVGSAQDVLSKGRWRT